MTPSYLITILRDRYNRLKHKPSSFMFIENYAQTNLRYYLHDSLTDDLIDELDIDMDFELGEEIARLNQVI